jgi:cell division protein FtsX
MDRNMYVPNEKSEILVQHVVGDIHMYIQKPNTIKGYKYTTFITLISLELISFKTADSWT